MSQLFRGDITNSVAELTLLDEEVIGGGAGTLSYGLGGTNNGEIKVVHKGDIVQSDGFYDAGSIYAGDDIKGVVIGTSCTSIGNFAFIGGAVGLGNLIIPNSVTSIGSNAFNGCGGGVGNKYVVIPESVTSIGSQAFYITGYNDLYTNTPASSWVGTNALDASAFGNVYTGPNATGYDAAWASSQGYNYTISTWTNYPNIP